ncbi:CaiB/BaiF CoA transferase family protein [Amycolatopsis thermophila]|uniref:Alpha-methylacyl-CoA racemase n=1 Tax=Amycolatopsis thermophila TaxID=206084 RepID=A0ABU0F0P7_9PSEU|nr:CaiB/BaiF CoA-transferase family protein [Amycolatopsis thermophila]MDQ0381132.1 alpha-methylacyl-CoA racemase [Amycolatopsis thermophila]
MSGPLRGVRVVELGGIGPAPFAAMMLSDLGAEVVRIDRPAGGEPGEHQRHELDLLLRGRRSIALDLKASRGRDTLLRLLDRADVLLDPFRPGVTERLGLGPGPVLERNPRLVYGRMTGWGQTGPLATAAGHDLNYVALAGPLAAMGRRGTPPPPALNLVGDFGGGGMVLVAGVLAALLERTGSNRGQVIDAAMIDGTAALFTSIVGFMNMGAWSTAREDNFLDGGAPYYDSYATADGRYVTIAALEPQFYALLLDRLGLDPAEWPQDDRSRWPALRARLTAIFAAGTRDHWVERLEGSDACFAPVLTVDEAMDHPHVKARGTYVTEYGMRQPAPVPRFDRTPGSIQSPPCSPGEHTRAALADWGVPGPEIAELLELGVAVDRPRVGSA